MNVLGGRGDGLLSLTSIIALIEPIGTGHVAGPVTDRHLSTVDPLEDRLRVGKRIGRHAEQPSRRGREYAHVCHRLDSGLSVRSKMRSPSDELRVPAHATEPGGIVWRDYGSDSLIFQCRETDVDLQIL